MFRLLLRSEGQVEAIANFDEAFNLMEDVHTNVIAGLALDDGETIAAWLPEAEVEFGPSAPLPPTPAPNASISPSFFPGTNSESLFDRKLFDQPDLTVFGPDGKPLTAEYVGLDGVTGLSILRLTDKKQKLFDLTIDTPAGIGESVRLFGPVPVRSRQVSRGNVYVKMGATDGRIRKVMRAPTGGVARLKVLSARLSVENIGGVALNEAGETIGIVDGVEGNEASILPAALIQSAAKRVLDRQASVPKPWLGVKGEPIINLDVEQLQNHGWQIQRATTITKGHQGIMLTSIVPGSPAAQASLRAGDVILKVDDEAVENADDFSWYLDQAGPTKSVRFTVARPDKPTDENFVVQLSGQLDSNSVFRPRLIPSDKSFYLLEQGIETIALKPVESPRKPVFAGLLIVYVVPSSPAFDAGLRAGDVIQSINGRPIMLRNRPLGAPTPGSVSTLEIIRKKERLVIKLPSKDKKEQ